MYHKSINGDDELEIITPQTLEEKDSIEQNPMYSKKPYFRRLWEVVYYVFPFGFVSFGGPQAHITNFYQKFVEELKWINEEQFEGLFAMSTSLPGSASGHV